MFHGKRSLLLVRFIAACVVVAAFGGAAIALANTGPSVPNTGGGPRPTGHHRMPKLSPAAARKRAALIAHKRQEGHHRATSHSAAVTTIGPGATFAGQGVTLSAAAPDASSYAAASTLASSAAAVSGFQNLAAAQTVFGPSTLSNHPTASLLTVTEQDPVVAGVTAGVPYSAWVVSVNGPQIDVGTPAGGPATGPPTATSCTDAAIYDVQINQWTELLQTC